MKPIGVMGGGSWGTALAVQFSREGQEVRLWVRRPEHAAELSRLRGNSTYLPDVELPPSLTATSEMSDLDDCGSGAGGGSVPWVPAGGEELPATASGGPSGDPHLRHQRGRGGDQRPHERGLLRGGHSTRIGRSSSGCSPGPPSPRSWPKGLPAAGVIASLDVDLAARLFRAQLSAKNYRLYTSTDVVGVELGGATKNVIAIAAGAVSGLGLGHNTLAALDHPRSPRDHPSGPRPAVARIAPFSGLAGLGDLVLDLHRRSVPQPPHRLRAGSGADAGRDHLRHGDGGGGHPQRPKHLPAGSAEGGGDADHRADGQGLCTKGVAPREAVAPLDDPTVEGSIRSRSSPRAPVVICCP